MNESIQEKEILEEKKDIQDYFDYFTSYFEEFYSFLPLPFCDLNPLFIIINTNNAFLDFFKYSKVDAVGQSISAIFKNKEDFKKFQKELRERGEIKERACLVITKENKDFTVNISIKERRDKDGNVIGYFISFVNVDELKKLQESLEQKIEERTKDLNYSRIALLNILEDVDKEKRATEDEKNKTLSIISNFSDGLLFFDREKRLLFANPQAEKFFQLKKGAVVGKAISQINTYPIYKQLFDFIGTDFKEMFRQELTLREKLILEVSLIEIFSEEKSSEFLIILHDITREKMVEKIKTEFVSVAAHQLRTPLSAIKWTLKMILDGDVGQISEEQQGFLEKTYISNERMISLVNDLLDITRIEEGRYLYRPSLVGIEEPVEFTINSLEEVVERKKIKINYSRPKIELPKIFADAEKIKLVIQNLIDNAVKYTSFSGEIAVSLKYDKEKKVIIFSVTDSGVGIPSDQQPRIFTKFFRGSNVVRMETEGSGFGLFISKNIIEAHGGKIWFESIEGEKTTFYFSLPVESKNREDFEEEN